MALSNFTIGLIFGRLRLSQPDRNNNSIISAGRCPGNIYIHRCFHTKSVFWIKLFFGIVWKVFYRFENVKVIFLFLGLFFFLIEYLQKRICFYYFIRSFQLWYFPYGDIFSKLLLQNYIFKKLQINHLFKLIIKSLIFMCQKLDRFQTAGWLVEIGIRKTYITRTVEPKHFYYVFKRLLKCEQFFKLNVWLYFQLLIVYHFTSFYEVKNHKNEVFVSCMDFLNWFTHACHYCLIHCSNSQGCAWHFTFNLTNTPE